MKKTLLAALAIGFAAATAGSANPSRSPEQAEGEAAFVYDDLDRFAATLEVVNSGSPAVPAFADYIARGSPAFPGYVERYGVTPESIAEAVARRPLHYRRVAGLKDHLRGQEARIQSAMLRLNKMAPGELPIPPVYYLVGNLYAGGIQVSLQPPVGKHSRGLVLLLEALSMSPETDQSEWQGRPYGGGYLEDIPYVAVHESAHVYQYQLMGADNYVSIYQSGNPNNTYLALAVREGCADYVTYLASGYRRSGKQHVYGLANERALWSAFQKVMNQPASFSDGWFGALDPDTPDWPPQIGYWLGSRMCQAFHETSADRDAAIRHIFTAYTADQMRPIADAYARWLEN